MSITGRLQLWGTTAAFIAGVSFNSFFYQTRMSHENGISTRCRIKLVDNPAFPAHDFFTPGREFIGRLRHSDARGEDNAGLEVRSVSLKFADSRDHSPLDFEMNTGRSFFDTARKFMEFAFATYKGGGDQYLPLGRDALRVQAFKESLRRHPTSYANQYYHSQLVTGFIDRAGKFYYAKYRIVPADLRPDNDGYPTERDLKNIVNQTRYAEETERPVTYLRDEYEARVKAGEVQYRLQIQLHTPSSDDPEDILSGFYHEWDTATHPWMDLASITVFELLPYEEEFMTIASISHHPASLPLLPATSMDDYNSVNFMRRHAVLAKRIRVLSYRVKGLPPRIGTPGRDKKFFSYEAG